MSVSPTACLHAMPKEYFNKMEPYLLERKQTSKHMWLPFAVKFYPRIFLKKILLSLFHICPLFPLLLAVCYVILPLSSKFSVLCPSFLWDNFQPLTVLFPIKFYSLNIYIYFISWYKLLPCFFFFLDILHAVLTCIDG